MKLPIGLLNSVADCRAAIRLFGLTPDEADRVITEEFRKAVNRLPSRPYPQETDHADRDCDT